MWCHVSAPDRLSRFGRGLERRESLGTGCVFKPNIPCPVMVQGPCPELTLSVLQMLLLLTSTLRSRCSPAVIADVLCKTSHGAPHHRTPHEENVEITPCCNSRPGSSMFLTAQLRGQLFRHATERTLRTLLGLCKFVANWCELRGLSHQQMCDLGDACPLPVGGTFR